MDNNEANRISRTAGAKSATVVTHNRPKRIPLGSTSKLKAPKREGFYRRFILDQDGRLEAALAAGYTPVTGDIETADPSVNTPAPNGAGSIVTAPAGRGRRLVLMELPEEFRQQDVDAKQKQVDEIEKSIIRTAKESGLEGNIYISDQRRSR